MVDDILDFTTPGLGFVEDFSLSDFDLDNSGPAGFLFSFLTGEFTEDGSLTDVESFFSCSFSSM